jgi:hypothetical protein
MIGKVLCLVGLHKWVGLWRPSRCSFYPFDILVNKTCDRCGKVVVPKQPTRPSDEEE